MRIIKSLREIRASLDSLAEEARGKVDEASAEDLATVYSLIERILYRMRIRGVIDPQELKEMDEERERIFQKLLEEAQRG